MRGGRWLIWVGVNVGSVFCCGLAIGSSSATADESRALTGVEMAKGSGPASAPAAIDLNTATVDQLDGLPGVGRKRAEAIIAQRQKRPFQRVTELLRIKGFGPKLFGKVRPFVFVGMVASASEHGGGEARGQRATPAQ